MSSCHFLLSLILPSITCFRRQFLRKMWPIQLAFRFLISCRIFLCTLTLSNTSSFLTWSVQLIFSTLLQHHISKLSRYFWSGWIPKSTNTHSEYVILIFHYNNDRTNSPQCYVKRTLSFLLFLPLQDVNSRRGNWPWMVGSVITQETWSED